MQSSGSEKAFGPDVPLRFDPNGVWAVDTAIKYGRQMEESSNTSRIPPGARRAWLKPEEP